MFVYIVVGRQWAGEFYIVAVFGQEPHARQHAARWLREHPHGEVDVQRYSILNGQG